MRHARHHRRHLDADQVVGDDLHVVLVHRAADEILAGLRRRRQHGARSAAAATRRGALSFMLLQDGRCRRRAGDADRGAPAARQARADQQRREHDERRRRAARPSAGRNSRPAHAARGRACCSPAAARTCPTAGSPRLGIRSAPARIAAACPAMPGREQRDQPARDGEQPRASGSPPGRDRAGHATSAPRADAERRRRAAARPHPSWLDAAMPYRNSTTSAPSRSTATATTTAMREQRPSAERDRRGPSARISRAISRPCAGHPDLVPAQHQDRDDQDGRVEQLLPAARRTRPTARRRTTASSAGAEHAGGDAAGDPARRAGRCPCVAASTMPTISPASNTSRKTMIRLASIGLFLRRSHGGDRAVRHVRMIVVEERVGAGLQRPGHDGDLAARHDDLLHPQVGALELGRRRVLVRAPRCGTARPAGTRDLRGA